MKPGLASLKEISKIKLNLRSDTLKTGTVSVKYSEENSVFGEVSY